MTVPGDRLYTTREAAALLGASQTSLKRWADEGRIACAKTVGKHRRFTRAELDRFMREGLSRPTSIDSAMWLDALVAGQSHDIVARLFDARGRLGSWAAVADHVGPLLKEIGEAWADGRITVIEEHMATAVLTQSLKLVSQTLPVPDAGPALLLLTPDQERHTVGLSLVELALRELGWRGIWIGASAPLTGLDAVFEDTKALGIAASASVHASDPAPLAEVAKQLGDLCRPRGAVLVLGGGGAWPEPPPYGARLHGLMGLSRHLELG